MKKDEKYEKEILVSYEDDEWKSVRNVAEQKIRYSKYAKDTMLKKKKINIELSEKDLTNLKVKSLEEGIPYQTLVSSVIHKFLSGDLIKNNRSL